MCNVIMVNMGIYGLGEVLQEHIEKKTEAASVVGAS